MTLSSAFNFGGGQVRYGIVGLGDITQESLLPGVEHTGNSRVTALVSGDRAKLDALGRQYGIDRLYGYEDFPALVASGEIDAVYIGTPNWRHAEFAIPALEAGIHVLCEKPLEISSDRCRAMIAAARRGRAKLMTAYRLHFEPANLNAIRRIRAGELGHLVTFTSCFGQMLDPRNHRAHNGIEAGPLFDMGPYPINAIRFLFDAEPVEVVSAVAARHAKAGFGGIDDTFAVTLRMPGNRLAQFVVSYFTDSIDSLIVARTKGSIHMSPAYGMGKWFVQDRQGKGRTERETFEPTDQFGGELRYFSERILKGGAVEPDGEEGLADLLVIEAIVEALRTGRPVPIAGFAQKPSINPGTQEQRLPPVSAPEPVDVARPSRD